MAYQWAPDYSSAIDLSKHPDAVWMPEVNESGSEGSFYRPAGWYSGSTDPDTGRLMPTTQITGVTDTGSNDGSIANNYWSLRDAGLWNLQDPNSETWKYLQAQSGGGDVLHDPNALFKGLAGAGLAGGAATSRDEAGRTQVEGALREALQGANPEFISQFAPAVGQAVSDYWTTSKQSENQGIVKDIGDSARVFRDMFTQTPLGVALIAATGGAALGAAGSGGAGAAEGGAAAGGATAGGLGEAGAGLEGLTAADLGMEALPFTTNPGLAELGGSIGADGLPIAGGGVGIGGSAAMPAAVPETPYDLANNGLFQTGPGQFEQLPMTAGGSGAFLGTSGLGTAATIAGGGTAASGLGNGGNASGGGTGSGSGGGTPLSRLFDGTATNADLLALGGTGLATGLGAYGASQQANAIRDIANQSRADRAPFLNQANAWLADPNAYLSGPGKASLDATLRGLSAKVGNPIDNPTALGIATQAGLMNWQNALTGMANLGLGGEDTRAQLGLAGANAQSGVYDALGYGLQQATQPRRATLADLLSGRGGLA